MEELAIEDVYTIYGEDAPTEDIPETEYIEDVENVFSE